MLTIAITILFAFAGVLAIAVIVDSLAKARAVYALLMQEGELMRAGFALQTEAVQMSLRPQSIPAPRRVIATRRVAMVAAPRLPLQACAA
jgi:hypothetical protein